MKKKKTVQMLTTGGFGFAFNELIGTAAATSHDVMTGVTKLAKRSFRAEGGRNNEWLGMREG